MLRGNSLISSPPQDEKGADVLKTLLQTQKQFDVVKIPSRSECDCWNDYVLELLKILRASDKSKWHHRIVFKVSLLNRRFFTSRIERSADGPNPL